MSSEISDDSDEIVYVAAGSGRGRVYHENKKCNAFTASTNLSEWSRDRVVAHKEPCSRCVEQEAEDGR